MIGENEDDVQIRLSIAGGRGADWNASYETQKYLVVPRKVGEPLGMVVVESGWGSMVPTVVIANMAPGGLDEGWVSGRHGWIFSEQLLRTTTCTKTIRQYSTG